MDCHHLASLVVSICDPRDRYFYPTLKLVKYSYLLHLCYRFECVKPRLSMLQKPKYAPTAMLNKIWMVTKCPSVTNSPAEYSALCEFSGFHTSLKAVTPVLHHDTAYKNIYCALCNGAKPNETFEYFDPELDCDSAVPLTGVNLASAWSTANCSIYFRSPNGIPLDVCQVPEYSVSTCNETGNWRVFNRSLEMACMAFVDPFNNTFKNYFCYLCNIDEPEPQTTWVCKRDHEDVVDIFPLFTAIISLSYADQPVENNLLDCDEDQFPDTKMVRYQCWS